MAKKRHYTRQEILAMCNNVARESRMCDRSPYTAMPILVLHTMLTGEGWKQKRLCNLASNIQDYVNRVDNGEITTEELSQRLWDKAGWSIEYRQYELSDIQAKKGTFKYWLDERQIYPQNKINEHSVKYLLCWFNCLMDAGYGKDRLQRVSDEFTKLLEVYRQDKISVRDMRKDLWDEGVAIEQPVDPLTQQRGSLMTV